MKNVTKILMIVVLAVFSIKSLAQTEQGKTIISGQSSLSFLFAKQKSKSDNGENEGPTQSELKFSPQIGYFVFDNLALGIAVPVEFSSLKFEDSYSQKSTLIAVAPFITYYFGNSNVKPFLQAAAGIGTSNSQEEYSGNEYENKYSVFLWNVSGGLAVFINEYVSFDFGVNYNSTSLKNKEDNSQNVRSITSGIGVNLGFSILF